MKNAIAVAALSAGVLSAQPPPAAPAKPDSEAVKALIEKAKKAGGPRWAEEAHFFCEAPRPNRPDDPPIEPTGPTFRQALNEQLGMKLRSGRGSVRTLVVDHVVWPREN